MLMRSMAVSLALLAACSSAPKKSEETGSETRMNGEFPEYSSPVARARLQERVDNIKYQQGVTLVSNLERIVQHGDAAITACVEGLKSPDAMTRMGCAYCLGRIGNTKTVPTLQAALKDDVGFVRYEVASALGTMGSKAGYRVLVQGLEDERLEYRYKCFEALKEFTGHDFGYAHNGSPEVRQVSVQRWNEWLQQFESESF
jgi:hypothetical protein